ncbi:hypothetical protein Snoj_35970 [Streptomyces nojiriensis]|uniref:Uncharacterized protein n=1 Tax=Streptomyces nojiriensis TaxID=66374 RepID=A0ABQ3SNJ0_9ACTN|nr:hypothetical protein [Streptomyces nojiriensis]QTI43235.1 hypothetical protein JYK04_00997 [Streptomyces nojiriensis]GGS11556.1 hypothetical protein GCM10010205_46340 [Streptomyces nojiriensis]GHI69679.1 hypothetical protein Snoj_35970 [Streptomyces nojiriensis]
MSPTRFASQHKWIYLGAIVLLVGFVVVGLIQYKAVRTTNQALDKANQLADELVAAGFTRPDPNTLARALGEDGGIVCEDPASALKSALWKINLSNGATGPGQRPVIADRRAVQAEALVLKVYCPDTLHRIQEQIDDLKTEQTVRRGDDG